MLHTSSWDVVRHLGDGKAGLEKEGLRVTKDGFMARTRDPFVGDPYIVKDFSENQTEINTPVCSCIGEAVDILEEYAGKIRKTLKEMPEPEYLWPFSNPPYIRSEDDIPVAQYEGADRVKTEYRNYLAGRYGKYMMTFSGIHFNYSFSDELLMAEYEAVCAEAAAAAAGAGADSERAEAAGAKPFDSFQDFKNHFYVSLAAKALVYNWLIVMLTAASPILDSSYLEKGKLGGSVFSGMSSVRCSEMGYWNFFTPVLDYSDIGKYADSIQGYIDYGMIRSSSELYFPIRIKPAGKYDLARLKENGVSHIELRMIDLNPFVGGGLGEEDAEFIKLLLIYLAAQPDRAITAHEQIQAVKNTKNAARYDKANTKIMMPASEEELCKCREEESPATSYLPKGAQTIDLLSASKCALDKVECFYKDILDRFEQLEPARERVESVIAYQKAKISSPEKRYDCMVNKMYGEEFVERGMKLAKAMSDEA